MLKKIKSKLAHFSWDLAYGKYNGLGQFDLSELQIVRNPYKNKWFADPFILEETSTNIQFLVEEFDYRIGRGRIARIEVDKLTDCIILCSIILDLPTHLSFPAIYRVDGKILVQPENSASGSSYIYKYDRTSDKLVNPIRIIDSPIVDPVILYESGIFKMFATLSNNPNGDFLYEYHSNSILGPYTFIKKHIYPNCTARMAGAFLFENKGIVRPSQNCKGGYGKSVIFYENKDIVSVVEPILRRYDGIHTFNTYNGSVVVDLKKYDNPLLYKLVSFMKK